MIKKVTTTIVIACLLASGSVQAGNTNGQAMSAVATYGTGIITNVAMAEKFYSGCSPTFWGAVNCVLGTASVAQAGYMGYALYQTLRTKDATSCDGQVNCKPNPANPNNPNGPGTPMWNGTTPGVASIGNGPQSLGGDFAKYQRRIEQLKAGFAEKGYTFDPNTGIVKGPKGSYNLAGMSSLSDLTKMGFDPQAVKRAEAIANDVLAKYGNATLNLGEEAGGGGYRAPVANDDGSAELKRMMGALNGGGRSPASTGVAGYHKYLGGQPIGVSGDNIFEMISRRYDAEEKKGTFLSSDGK